jgi:hypothetical protein
MSKSAKSKRFPRMGPNPEQFGRAAIQASDGLSKQFWRNEAIRKNNVLEEAVKELMQQAHNSTGQYQNGLRYALAILNTAKERTWSFDEVEKKIWSESHDAGFLPEDVIVIELTKLEGILGMSFFDRKLERPE